MIGAEGPQQQWTIAVWTTGQVSFQFGSMATRPPFHNESLLLELVEKVNQIPVVSITPDKMTKYPSVNISTFSDPMVLRELLDVLDWIVDITRKALEPVP